MATTKPEGAQPNVLIVENDNGEVYIVDNEESISQVEKILKSCGIKKLSKQSAELQESFSSSKKIKITTKWVLIWCNLNEIN